MNADILTHFKTLKDPRVERTKRYPLMELIFLIISATISGCDGWKSMRDFGLIKLDWLRKFFPYENGIPVDDTLARLMRRLDTKAFQSCFISWMQSVSEQTNGQVIAIDGKTLRGSYDKSDEKSAIHMVSAFSNANGLVLGQEKTAEKSNEITAIPALLEVLSVKGCIVTIDAMGCQKEIAEKIISEKGEYLLSLKGNQGNLHTDVKDFFESLSMTDSGKLSNIKHEYHEDIDCGHGRIETRRAYVIDPKMYQGCFRDVEKWKALHRIVMIDSVREMTDKTTRDRRFYITSSKDSAQSLLESTRAHWSIENTLHWTLDMTFKEDASRIRKEASPENYAIVRHIAMNILKKDKSIKASIKGKRHIAALDDNARSTLIKNMLI